MVVVDRWLLFGVVRWIRFDRVLLKILKYVLIRSTFDTIKHKIQGDFLYLSCIKLVISQESVNQIG
jgi:hypothetical protein